MLNVVFDLLFSAAAFFYSWTRVFVFLSHCVVCALGTPDFSFDIYLFACVYKTLFCFQLLYYSQAKTANFLLCLRARASKRSAKSAVSRRRSIEMAISSASRQLLYGFGVTTPLLCAATHAARSTSSVAATITHFRGGGRRVFVPQPLLQTAAAARASFTLAAARFSSTNESNHPPTMSKTALILVHDNTEDIELVATSDVLRRANVDVRFSFCFAI